MRIVVVGATGNVGTALLRRLAAEPDVTAVSGVARRLPDPVTPYENVDWIAVDVGADDAVPKLTDGLAGAGAVIHMAWQIHPSHERDALRGTHPIATGHVDA